MAFERTVRHVNEVKEECQAHSYDPVVATAPRAVNPPPVTEAPQDAAAENPIAQSAVEIAEMKKKEELAKKEKNEMIKLMTNQRKLQRAKEKREVRIKEQLDSISMSDAEQRFAKVQQNKATNVSRYNLPLRFAAFKFMTADTCMPTRITGSRHHALWHSCSRPSGRKV